VAVVFYMSRRVSVGYAMPLSEVPLQFMGLLTRFFLLFVGITLGLAARAAPVADLYAGTVAGSATEVGHQALARDALKQVMVRVTGRLGAAADPRLAGLYERAASFVQTSKSAGPNQITLQFDQSALEAALGAAGVPVWSTERPLTLVVLVNAQGAGGPMAPAASVSLRRDIERVATLRGVRVGWLPALDPLAQQRLFSSAVAGRLDELQAVAAEYSADGVLLGRVTNGLADWSWSGAGVTGVFSGAAADAVNALADQYAAALTSPSVAESRLLVVVHGVKDAAAYVNAERTLAALNGVRRVSVVAVDKDTVRLQVLFKEDEKLLRRLIARVSLFGLSSETTTDGALHLIWMAP